MTDGTTPAGAAVTISDSKPWYTSKSLWAAIIGQLATLVCVVLKGTPHNAALDTIPSVLSTIVGGLTSGWDPATIVASVMSIAYGVIRMFTSQPISGFTTMTVSAKSADEAAYLASHPGSDKHPS
jgi:hypothetical protein